MAPKIAWVLLPLALYGLYLAVAALRGRLPTRQAVNVIVERWLLGAVARGLAACPVGAFYDDEAAALIGVDRERQWVLHFAAMGVPSRQADL